MTEPTSPGSDDLPSAVPARSRWSRLPLIWVLPAVVILAGAFVVIHEKLAQGTSVEIRFHNAEDLEANKTKIRYKEVEIGDVRDIHVSKDRKEVDVTAIIHRDASEYLRSEEHTSELQSPDHLVCRLLLEKKKDIGLQQS